jgi:hypothetical protein
MLPISGKQGLQALSPGRLRRVLAQVHCEDLPESPTAHLPIGIGGHRRQKKATPRRYDHHSPHDVHSYRKVENYLLLHQGGMQSYGPTI